MIILAPLTVTTAIKAAEWRNSKMESCRTPVESTPDRQREWFEALPHTSHRYWQVMAGEEAVGLAGLTYVSWENRSAEISLVMATDQRNKGLGKLAVLALLDMGFNRMNLDVIYGECFECAENLGFWKKALASYPTYWTELPDRKFWNGKYWKAYYFSIGRKNERQRSWDHQ